MEKIIRIFNELNEINSTELLNKSSFKLCKVIDYLTLDVFELENRFLESELTFRHKVKMIILKKSNGFLKLFPFLISNIERTNLQFLKNIDRLFDQKQYSIDKRYEKDIYIVNDFLNFARSRIKSCEYFYLESYYSDKDWAKNEFPKNMFNYLSHKIKTNPNALTSSFLVEIKVCFSIIGLGLLDESKVLKANDYFLKTSDPFSFNIPNSFDDVKTELRMVHSCIGLNEILFDHIVNDVINKYRN